MATYSRRDLIEKINSIAEFCGYNEVVQIFCDNGLLSLEMIEEIEDYSDDNVKKQILLDNVINLNKSDLENILIALKHHKDGSYKDLEFSLINKTISSAPATLATLAPLDIAQLVSDEVDHQLEVPMPINIPELPVRAAIEAIYVGEGLELEPYTEDVTPSRHLNVRRSDRFHMSGSNEIGTYSMESINRGIFFLVNMINFKEGCDKRQGALVDRDNLISLYRQMGFTCFYYEDITESQLFKLLEKLINSSYLGQYDSFVFTVLSHGFEKDEIGIVHLYDKAVRTFEIIKLFNNHGCHCLNGKPKVFLFPICRGEDRDSGKGKTRRMFKTGSESESPSDAGRDMPVEGTEAFIPYLSDIKICYSTLPGYVSLRHFTEGICYIQVLCDVFGLHAHNTNLDDMMKIISQKMRSQMVDNHLHTTSTTDWGFDKVMFFNPGLNGIYM